ncbi:hypothetical protein A1O7_00788 [Cladophialophora yegresii CBS 114405]|uniref:Uncharacterized protein n=1 Tax=Cladophialophora yegresii CBS 114405 TaxID=1182544 RepID=W9W8L8_9EURO|nr:uncharacterized protein A1O7_00788 [Cladophialophora yegresii CBS 114405]EXJ64452.1 hypothetical protein A1O7_00788 [Cladophialophora yegresii CBS 114405]
MDRPCENAKQNGRVENNGSLDVTNKCRPVGVGEQLPETMEFRRDPVKGEGLFARRDISVHEPICALPYSIFMALETEKLTTTCYSCLAVTSSHIPYIKGTAQEELSLKTCTGCSQVKFCGKACQTKAWKAYHKLECRIFDLYRHNFPPMMIRAAMRVVLLKDKGLLPQQYWNALTNDVVSHEDIWKAAPENNITAMVRDIKFVTNSKLSLETITRMFWVMRTNSIELPVSVHGGIGTMLDPFFAKFNHNCDANAMLYRPWHTVESGWNLESNPKPEQRSIFATVIPLRDIKKGEELTIFYSDPTLCVKERNAKHMMNYYFECTCSRCVEDTKTATEVEDRMPVLSAQYVALAQGVLRQLEQLRADEEGGRLAYDRASQAWEDGIAQYLDFPQLYTAGDFDQISLHLAVSGLQLGTFDKALINLLRSYFLIYPSRIPGRHNYSNIHIMFVMLETFDILLGINCKDKTMEVARSADVKGSLRRLSKRGFSIQTLLYWRLRICVHLRKCLEASAAKDLLPLVARMQDRVLLHGGSEAGPEEDPFAEDAMKKYLKLSEARWKVVLNETGC